MSTPIRIQHGERDPRVPLGNAQKFLSRGRQLEHQALEKMRAALGRAA